MRMYHFTISASAVTWLGSLAYLWQSRSPSRAQVKIQPNLGVTRLEGLSLSLVIAWRLPSPDSENA